MAAGHDAGVRAERRLGRAARRTQIAPGAPVAHACHGADGEGGIGPAWAGSLGTEIELDDGTTVTVDEAYLTRAIADPGARRKPGSG